MNIDRSAIRTITALGVGCALTLAACGDGDSETAAEAVAATATTDTDGGYGSERDTASGSENAIVISDFTFTGVTEVAVGTTLVVTNADASRHTFTAVDGTFDSGALAQNDTFEITFTEAGEFSYFCNFHPSMTGTIIVTG